MPRIGQSLNLEGVLYFLQEHLQILNTCLEVKSPGLEQIYHFNNTPLPHL